MSKALDMTIEEIYDHFPKDIPQKFFDDIDTKAKPHYLWIMKKQELYCDNCSRKFAADEIHDIVKHNHKYRCPYCHREMLARKIGVAGHNSAKRCALTYHFGQSIIDKDVITCMAIFSAFRGQVTKADKKYLYEHGHAIKTEVLEVWQKLRRVGSYIPLEDVEKLFKNASLARGYVVNKLIDILNEIGASLKKFSNM